MNMMTAAWLLDPEGAQPGVAPLPRLFRNLAPGLRDKVLSAFTKESFADGRPIPTETVGNGAVAVVLTGALREDLAEPDGTSRILGLSFVGEVIAPLGPRPEAETGLCAIGDTSLLTCDAETFDALMAGIPGLRAAWLCEMNAHFAEVRHWQVLLGSRTATERVAALMLWLRKRQGCPVEFALHLNRRELGQLTFLTLETVSRQIKALERMGAIALPTPSHVRVCNPDLLLAESGIAPLARCAA